MKTVTVFPSQHAAAAVGRRRRQQTQWFRSVWLSLALAFVVTVSGFYTYYLYQLFHARSSFAAAAREQQHAAAQQLTKVGEISVGVPKEENMENMQGPLTGEHSSSGISHARLLSRNNPFVKVTADVRGNLGPPLVMIHDGTDWIKDRWQAASDMHGTAIRGVHWVALEFPSLIRVERVVLDWEAAFSRDYKLEVRKKPTKNEEESDWITLFDSHRADQDPRCTVEEQGQSPGVKSKTPLHVIHTLDLSSSIESFHELRVWIRKSAMGWGVSLWNVDVYGTTAIDESEPQ